jgi:hypothetical protein
MALMDYASVVQTYLLWKSLFFHAARPVYTDTVFLNPLKRTINVYTGLAEWKNNDFHRR